MKHEIISIAEKYLGLPFHYHKCDLHHQLPNPQRGFDCSGFVRWVLREAGYQLPPEVIHARNLFDLFGTGISPEEAQPGDLIFFTQWGTTPNHVAFVAGKDKVLHCSSRVPGVGYSTLDFLFETIFPPVIDQNITTTYPRKYFANPIGYKRLPPKS